MRLNGFCWESSFIFLLCNHTVSKTSYKWRLNLDSKEGKIVGDNHDSEAKDDDMTRQNVIMDILLSTVTNHDGMWKITRKEDQCMLKDISLCQDMYNDHQTGDKKEVVIENSNIDEDILYFGEPVNFSQYDHLVGIKEQSWHLHGPERIKKSKQEKPQSVKVYISAALTLWRKGDIQESIECFRCGLAVSPNNTNILLNLAEVLYRLQYLDDAIFLTRRSLSLATRPGALLGALQVRRLPEG